MDRVTLAGYIALGLSCIGALFSIIVFVFTNSRRRTRAHVLVVERAAQALVEEALNEQRRMEGDFQQRFDERFVTLTPKERTVFLMILEQWRRTASHVEADV